MFLRFLRPNNLSQKMLRVIFSIYLLVTCLITSVQFLSEYLKTQDSISKELIQLQETVLDSVATSMWQYNQTQLQTLSAGLVKMPIIEGVDIFDKQGQSLISKRVYAANSQPMSVFETQSELNWQLNGERIFLGTLVLYSSSEVVLDRVLFGFSLIGLTEFIKLSLLFWLFIWAFDRYMAKPLKELMSQVDKVQLNQNVSQRINLSNIENNELSLLQKHMNEMLAAIQSDRQKLLEDEQSKRNWLEEAVAKRTEELQVLNKKLENMASTDSLTGVLNRGRFFETAQRLLALGQRQKTPTCLVLMDLDNFKSINDTFGHFSGDKVLIHFTETIQTFLRKSDLVGRLGGEEFGIFLNDTNSDDAFMLANKIRKAIANASLEVDGKTITYLGVEASEPEEASIDDMFKRADVKLFGAKDKGRNRVEV